MVPPCSAITIIHPGSQKSTPSYFASPELAQNEPILRRLFSLPKAVANKQQILFLQAFDV